MTTFDTAVFSEDRCYRYLLRRRVGESSRRVLFIMLNPSKADEKRNDATIRRCVGFARSWGFGILEVVNLFALMSTNPEALLKAKDPVGPDNDAAIRAALEVADTVVLAWGNHALDHEERARYGGRDGAGGRATILPRTDAAGGSQASATSAEGHPSHTFLPRHSLRTENRRLLTKSCQTLTLKRRKA